MIHAGQYVVYPHLQYFSQHKMIFLPFDAINVTKYTLNVTSDCQLATNDRARLSTAHRALTVLKPFISNCI